MLETLMLSPETMPATRNLLPQLRSHHGQISSLLIRFRALLQDPQYSAKEFSMYSILMSCPRLTGLNCAWQSAERIEESYRG